MDGGFMLALGLNNKNYYFNFFCRSVYVKVDYE